jgi:hypothetical protein
MSGQCRLLVGQAPNLGTTAAIKASTLTTINLRLAGQGGGGESDLSK